MRKLEEMTDEQLALAYVEGDNRAFDLLLSRNEVKLFGYIMFVVHDQEKANDVFQETFVKVVTKQWQVPGMVHAHSPQCDDGYVSRQQITEHRGDSR